MPLTKSQALAHISALYAVLNAADSDNPETHATWTHQDMAGGSGCRHLDAMLRDWVKLGVLTSEELETFYALQ